MKRRPLLIASLLALALAACPEDKPAETDPGPADIGADLVTPPDAGGETVESDLGPGDTAAPDSGPDPGSQPPSYTLPGWFPAADETVDEVEVVPALGAPVRVIYDSRGIPHIYGADRLDLAFAQGYVTARYRLFQMHTLRSAASGRLAEFSGVGSVRGDVLLRALELRQTAEAMAAQAQTDDPALYELLEAFAAGVNHHLEKVNAGTAPAPMEVSLYGMQLAPWTPADTMVVVRLQTWDLSFEGQLEEDSLLATALELKEQWDGTPLEGIESDVIDFTPPVQTVTADPATPPGASTFDLDTVLADPFFAKLQPEMLLENVLRHREMRSLPHRYFSQGGPDVGSNNWAVAGDHTASGAAIVANDAHLSLRNPAVFFQVHVSDKLAGGDTEVAGVNFAGAPGAVLGTNGFAAWAATVFYSDVTDTYVETLNGDGTAVLFDGGEVPLEERQEVIRFARMGDVECDDVLAGWITKLDPSVVAVGDAACELTVTLRKVPHHGPVIPWSYGQTDKDGNDVLMTWRWTGLEPTTDLSALIRLNSAGSVADFKAALDDFGVGAQNWVYGDQDGNIAWYPSHLLPLREHIEAGDTTYPPFLPMPGDGTTEWAGFLDRSLLPQVTNPASGVIVTANSDPIGVSFDNDPFNDGPYIGYVWDPGFRHGRVTERIDELVAAGGITAADMSAVQADHHSNLGERITPHLLTAIAAARNGDDPAAQALLTAAVDDAETLLNDWDFEAASGVGAADGSDEAKSAAATAIFNVFVVRLTANLFADEGIDVDDDLFVRLLLRMLEDPAGLATYDDVSGESLIWDDQTTADATESKTEILVKSLVEALAFLADPAKVGVAQQGGFGTADTNQWRWGALHTVTLHHNVAGPFSIPPSTQLPDGFPRPCDNYCVDASHPGLGDTNFTFRSGPSIRNVYELVDPVVAHTVIPGGQDENHAGAHYSDEMDLWVANQAPELLMQLDDVLADKETILDIVPQSAVQ